MRTTKIVATLGPATDAPNVLRSLFEAGVDVFRFNASHGTQEEHAKRIGAVRAVASELRTHAGILLDLQGPKIRLGTFVGGAAELKEGQIFRITVEEVEGTAERASTSYKDFVKDVKPGDQVLIADGAIELRVIDKTATDAICEVISGGVVTDRKGINLPGVELSTSSLTKKDLADLRFGIQHGIDFVALSFVRKRDDVLKLKLYLEESEQRIPIIAKIEKPEAWKNIDSILQETDGVMVARGDLGVEMALEKVPFIQKSIISLARRHGKFVITATQMLESMIEHPYPTRAEVSDVANAIYDGTDAVMLSAETSAGKYPVESARMMARIAAEAERSLADLGFREPPPREDTSFPEIMADGAYRAARLLKATSIVVFTSTGASARRIARFRPPVPIFAFTQSECVARQLSIVYGVRAVLAPQLASTDEMLATMDRILLEQGWLQQGDQVVFVAGLPIGQPGATNFLKLHRIGELW
jgi:pyruvate kinase